MGKGRKPLPRAIKLLRGNPGKRRLNAHEPQWKPGCEQPSWLTPYAAEEWARVAPELDVCGLLTEVAQTNLAVYCEAVAIMRQALEYLARANILISSEKKKAIRHPGLTIFWEAVREVRAAGSEFGFTPASATKLHGAYPRAKDDLEEFLAG